MATMASIRMALTGATNDQVKRIKQATERQQHNSNTMPQDLSTVLNIVKNMRSRCDPCINRDAQHA